jgi:hypothetical protein
VGDAVSQENVASSGHAACMTMTCVDATTSLHRTASIPPPLHPLADLASPVAPISGDGPVRNVRMWPRPNGAVRPCRVHRAQRGRWSSRKSDDGKCVATTKGRRRPSGRGERRAEHLVVLSCTW